MKSEKKEEETESTQETTESPEWGKEKKEQSGKTPTMWNVTIGNNNENKGKIQKEKWSDKEIAVPLVTINKRIYFLSITGGVISGWRTVFVPDFHFIWRIETNRN